MEGQISYETELNAMMECSICTEVFRDPRVLPCQHTFCLECLLNHGKDRQPGDTIPCPQCRKEFTIPDDGLSATQKNFVMEKLINVQNLSAGKQASTCGFHAGKQIEVFCKECKLAMCIKCCSEAHKQHEFYDVETVTTDLRNEMKNDTDKATELLTKAKQVLSRVEKRIADLLTHLADIEAEINQTADRLIDSVQQDRKKLLSEVESIRHKQVEQVETAKQEVKQHMVALESFTRYGDVLLSSGTACDVARSAASLRDGVDELTMFDVTGQVQNSLPTVTVKFTASSVIDREPGNLVGKVTEAQKSPTATHVITAGDKVRGVTSLGDHVFVLRFNIKHVEVYHAVTFALRRCIELPELDLLAYSLAVCAVNKCLYIADINTSSIHRIKLLGINATTNWSVARKPIGVSVNSLQHLLVVSAKERKLQEFTTSGNLLRSIDLQPDIEFPRHVVQLSSDKFLISHDGSVQRVCQVDATGAVVRSYGGAPGSDLTKVNYPKGLAVDAHGHILVADTNNNRLLVLDPALSSAQEMSVSVDGGLKQPRSLYYDKSRRRLYIGEWEGGRVIVIDNMQDFTTASV